MAVQVHEILMGLQYLHKRNVLHGWLTPSNVLVDDMERALINDFAVSKLCEDSESSSPQQPTVTSGGQGHVDARYLSPEINRDRVMSQEADLYSWAAIAVEVLSRGEKRAGYREAK